MLSKQTDQMKWVERRQQVNWPAAWLYSDLKRTERASVSSVLDEADTEFGLGQEANGQGSHSG